MKALAIVPARGGSKRLPGKHLLDLGGKPLIQHTLEAATGSRVFDKVILSSDAAEILEFGKRIDGVTPETRDPRLADDQTKVIDLVKSIAERPDVANEYDCIALLLPTCPFRTAADIKAGATILTKDAYAVVSICKKGEPLQLTVTLDSKSGLIDPEAVLKPSPLVTGMTRSQEFQAYYRVNGGFYIAWMSEFRKRENFFQGRVKGYVMDANRSVDIDYEQDLMVARFLLEQGYITSD